MVGLCAHLWTLWWHRHCTPCLGVLWWGVPLCYVFRWERVGGLELGWKGEVACVVLDWLVDLGLVAFIMRISSWRLSLWRFSQHSGLGLPFVPLSTFRFSFRFKSRFSRSYTMDKWSCMLQTFPSFSWPPPLSLVSLTMCFDFLELWTFCWGLRWRQVGKRPNYLYFITGRSSWLYKSCVVIHTIEGCKGARGIGNLM